MQKVRLLILENDEENVGRLREYFTGDDKFDLVAVTGDGEEGLRLIREYRPEVALIGLYLSGIDGIGVLERLRAEDEKCLAIMMGAYIDDTLINRIMSKGAYYYLVKPFAPEIAAERILEGKEDGVITVSRKTLDEDISNIFISIGIPPHIKGYAYLREGIKMAVNKPSIINKVTKELYPKIGDKFDTSASKVERAIRHAIEVAWNKGRIDAINSVFGSRVYIGTEKPTNSEFIALVADKLILKYI